MESSNPTTFLLETAGWASSYFFWISGFVIFSTIERCSSFADFMWRRWLRLFPAMAIASAILFTLDRWAPLRGPDSNAGLADLLPGITFISPSIGHAMTHWDVRSLDSSFWTLYVETSFIWCSAFYISGSAGSGL